MEPGETPYREERRRLPVAFLAGAIIVLLIFGGFLLLTHVMHSHSAATVVKLPFGPAEQAYAPHIQFLDIQLAHATNFLNQDFTYVAGTVLNDGTEKSASAGSYRGISRSLSSGNLTRYKSVDWLRLLRHWIPESVRIFRSKWNIFLWNGISSILRYASPG